MAKLYFYYSAMHAGKPTMLLQSAHNYHEHGMRTLIVTPHLDHRYGIAVAQSCIGLKWQATVFNSGDDLRALVQNDIAQHGALNCVLVDEAQSLKKSPRLAADQCRGSA
jgi:thymidine kinase